MRTCATACWLAEAVLGLAAAWLLLATMLLPHFATVLLAAAPAASRLPRGADVATIVAPCCVVVAHLVTTPLPCLNGVVAAHAALPNYLHRSTFSGCVVY